MRHLKLYAFLAVLLSNFMLPPPALADNQLTTLVGDTNFDKVINTVDVQCFLLAVKNADSGVWPDCMDLTYEQADLNCDGKLNVVDAQIEVVMAFKKPLLASLDADSNGAPDCQEKKKIDSLCKLQWEKFPPTDVYSLYQVWGTSSDNIYAVGNYKLVGASTKQFHPLLLHFDGETWKEIFIEGMAMKNAKYLSVWGTAADNVFIVGEMPTKVDGTGLTGIMLHFDGDNWSKINHDVTLSNSFRTVWGYDSDNVFVGGNILSKGIVLKYNGQKLESLKTNLPAMVLDVAGLSANHLFVHLGGDLLYEFKDSSWKPALTGNWKFNKVVNAIDNNSLYGIVLSEQEKPNILVQYDQKQEKWVETDFPAAANFYLYDVIGKSVQNLYVIGMKSTPSSLIAGGVNFDSMYAHFVSGSWHFAELQKELAGKGMQDAWAFDDGGIVTSNQKGEIYLYREQCS